MNNAHKQVTGAQIRTIAVLKNDRFLADAKWESVEKFTSLENPYEKVRLKSFSHNITKLPCVWLNSSISSLKFVFTAKEKSEGGSRESTDYHTSCHPKIPQC